MAVSLTNQSLENYTIQIPDNVPTGPTRMRIAMKMGYWPSLCGEFADGETEDYTVYLTREGQSCEPHFVDTDNHIERLQIGNITNHSGANGYTDYTGNANLKIVTQRGAGVPFEIGVDTDVWSTNDSFLKIWVDYNQNGSFDSGELVVVDEEQIGPFESSSVHAGAFQIPNTAKLGVTRMRVWMDTNDNLAQNFNPCGLVGDGEVEDYQIEIRDNYCAANATSTHYEWIEEVKVGTVSNLDDDPNMMVNTSGNNNGYGNFKSSITQIQQGLSYPIGMTPGFANVAYNEYWRVWVDLNQNGNFEANEMIFETEEATKESVKAYLTVLPSFPTGLTMMRVAMKYGGRPDACGTMQYGEYEDYMLNILPMSVGTDEAADATNSGTTGFEVTPAVIVDDPARGTRFDNMKVKVFPNPSQGKTYVNIKLNDERNVEVGIYALTGQSVKTFQLGTIQQTNHQMDLSDLPEGTYIVKVLAGKELQTKKLNIIKK